MPTPHLCILLIAEFHLAIDVAFDIAFGDGVTFVVLLLALGDADFDFDVLIIKEDAEWHKGIALATNHTPNLVELAAFEE